MRILVVDDEPTILETVQTKLKKEGYGVSTATSAEEGMRIFREMQHDLLILDVMLPNRSGYDLCRAVRKDSSVPIIMLTARSTDEDRLQGFELGADDYVTKPFNLSELSARVKAVLRRSAATEVKGTLNLGDLVVNPERHEALLNGRPLELSPKEFFLLYFLASNPGKVFTREALLDRVWGQDSFVSPRTVDVHVRWLREKLEADPSNPTRILTVRGIGYKFSG